MRELIYVNIIGNNSEEELVYEFYFSDEAEMAWGMDWEYRPATVCNIGIPQRMNYDSIKIVRSKIILTVAQKNSCFSMQDCKDGVIPIAWENIDGYEDYPDDGRMVLPFGTDIDSVEFILNSRGMFFDINEEN